MGKYSMKGSSSKGGGTSNSRHVSQKSGAQGNYAAGSPSLKNVGTGLGTGDQNTRYSSTKPSGASGKIGTAQPLTKAPGHSVNSGTNTIGNVYKSTKPNS